MDELESYKCSKSFPASMVVPVEDYASDTRKYLTFVALPTPEIISEIYTNFVAELQAADPDQYFCRPESLHFTILSIRLFEDGSNFDQEKINQIIDVAQKVFAKHKSLKLKINGSLALPTSIGVRCYSSEAFKHLIQDLKLELKKVDVVSDKKLISEEVLFSNITVTRFKPNYCPNQQMIDVVNKYRSFDFGKMILTDIKLVHANAVMSTTSTKILTELNLDQG